MKTISQIREAETILNREFKKKPELQQGKLAYAWKKFVDKNYTPFLEEVKEKLEDLRIEHCLTDKAGAILKDENGGYKFSKEGLRAFNKESSEVLRNFENKEIEVIPFVVKDNPLELIEEELELLKGIVL